MCSSEYCKFLRTLFSWNTSGEYAIPIEYAIFGFADHKVNYHLINHILLIFKYYVYKTRENGSLDLKVLKRNIQKIKNIEKQNF